MQKRSKNIQEKKREEKKDKAEGELSERLMSMWD
jgi:hypothetical protein